MQHYSYQQVHHYSAKQIFDLVIDVEKYPEFLSWVSNAKILSFQNHVMMAELFVSFKGFGYSYISEVTYQHHGENYEVKAEANNGPFTSLISKWIISKIDEQSCKIDFTIQFHCKSRLLNKVIGSIFETTAKQMLHSFQKRAKDIYKS